MHGPILFITIKLLPLSDGVVDLRNLIGLEQCNNSHIALNFIIALRETVQI